MFPFAKYGLKELFLGVALFACLAALCWFYCPWLMPVPAAGAIFVASFFRDPKRTLPEEQSIFTSPCDGTVAEISVLDHPVFGPGTLKIGIFMSVFNVHVNRMPLSGKIVSVTHTPGKFMDAREPQSAILNENNFIVARSLDGGFDFGVRQIAGLIARRIVCECAPEETLTRGEKFGMIKFGSRTEVYLPNEKVKEVKVKVLDKVKGGLTVLGELK